MKWGVAKNPKTPNLSPMPGSTPNLRSGSRWRMVWYRPPLYLCLEPFYHLLIYGCFKCMHILCKFRTEIPMRKYSNVGWVQVDTPPNSYGKELKNGAQTGVKSSLGTQVLGGNCASIKI